MRHDRVKQEVDGRIDEVAARKMGQWQQMEEERRRRSRGQEGNPDNGS
jgi:hypothetical protein